MIQKFNTVNSKKGLTITKEEEESLIHMIIQHSDKDEISDDSYVELLKDVDSLDRYLHGILTDGSYVTRCQKVLQELSII